MLDLFALDYLNRLYQEDRMREAEQERRLRQVPKAPPRNRFLRPILLRLGGLLVAWGRSLQKRYGVTDLTPACPACHPTR